MRRRGNISKRCMVCIMSAMMMMSSVTGTMIAPMGAYATPYSTTTEVPEDTDGHRNLASEDTLDVNDGTIHENRGTIRENNGTVENNDSGTVVSNSGTVYWGNVTTNESSGTVIAANVTDNYGTATEESTVTNNYALAENSTVTDNWASGTVSGLSLVTNNHGGRIIGTDVQVTNSLESDPGPNPPEQPQNNSITEPTITTAEMNADQPKQEENNDPPQPKVKKTNDGYVSELVNEIDKKLNGIVRNETIYIDFRDRDNLTVDELRTLLFYTPSNITINCIFLKNNGERYYLYIYPRIPQLTIGEKGNVVLVTDWAYHSCLDELSKEDGQLAGPNRIVEIFNEFHIECKLVHKGARGVLKPEDPPRYDNIKDISIQSDQPQTTAITNAKAQTTAITNAKAQTAAITNANAAIAPVSNNLYIFDANAYAASTSNKEVFVPYIYQDEAKWDDAKMREIANQSDPGMRELVYQDMKEKKGKWVRYGADGKMLKGWVTIGGDLAELYPDQAGNTYYYDTVTGTMARGTITIDGVSYYFNKSTGVLDG